MSIFLGKTSSNSKVLHIYSGSTDIEENVFSGTSFHSSLPYMRFVDKIRFTRVTALQVIDIGTYSVARCDFQSTIPMPSTKYLSVFAGVKDGVRYFFPTSMSSSGMDYAEGVYAGAIFYECPAIGFVSDTYLVVQGIKEDAVNNFYNPLDFDYIDVYLFENNIAPISSNEVLVSKNLISVNGNDILSNKYVHVFTDIAQRLNDYDEIIGLPYGGYLVNNVQFYANIVRSTSNTSFTLDGTEGGIVYIQLINSYPFDPTAIELRSNENAIVVTKNNITMNLFKTTSDMKFKTIDIPDFVMAVYGDPANFIKTYNIGTTLNDVMIVRFDFGLFWTMTNGWAIVHAIDGVKQPLLVSSNSSIYLTFSNNGTTFSITSTNLYPTSTIVYSYTIGFLVLR